MTPPPLLGTAYGDFEQPKAMASASTGLALQARDLRMSYGAEEVLKGVNLTVRRGEVVALLGPNGAGKTTTIEIFEGIRRRSSGSVSVLGVDPEEGGEEWQSRLGVVLQSWRDHRRWQVRELICHLASHYRIRARPSGDEPYEADDLLAAVGLSEQAHKRVGHLSGGQRRRLDVAIGLVGNPELLFLDEPTVGFDPEARRDFHNLLQSITRMRRTAVILTTHDLKEADLLADSVAILLGGRIVARGPTEEIARRFAHGTAVSYRLGGGELQEEIIDSDPVTFVRHLLARNFQVTELVVRPRTLEEAYLNMVGGADVPTGNSSCDAEDQVCS